MKYNKLIRDKLPAKIMQSGKAVTLRTLNDDEYKTEVENKLYEEVSEFCESKAIVEIADIVEVIYALIDAYGFRKRDVYRLIKKKRRERGGFKKKVFLEWVEDTDVEEVKAENDTEVKADDDERA